MRRVVARDALQARRVVLGIVVDGVGHTDFDNRAASHDRAQRDAFVFDREIVGELEPERQPHERADRVVRHNAPTNARRVENRRTRRRVARLADGEWRAHFACAIRRRDDGGARRNRAIATRRHRAALSRLYGVV